MAGRLPTHRTQSGFVLSVSLCLLLGLLLAVRHIDQSVLLIDGGSTVSICFGSFPFRFCLLEFGSGEEERFASDYLLMLDDCFWADGIIHGIRK